jgi:hypothetical protein
LEPGHLHLKNYGFQELGENCGMKKQILCHHLPQRLTM